MTFRTATHADLDAVLALYEEAKRGPFCVWNEAYPTREDAEADLAGEDLYVLDDGGVVIGALSVVPENELDDQPCWQLTGEGVREIARVVVAAEYHGHGYAGVMVAHICAILRERGERALHISVATSNPPARKTYPRQGFVEVGEAELFGGAYVLMEKRL